MMVMVTAICTTTVQAKEYLGFDVGKDSFEKVVNTLASQNVSYQIDYEEDKNGNKMNDFPLIKIKSYAPWEQYGTVKAGEFGFTQGKLAVVHAAWEDKGINIKNAAKDLFTSFSKEPERPLFYKLDMVFRQKYEIESYPQPHSNFTEATYNDKKIVEIRLRRSIVKPDRNPLGLYYQTDVTYWDVKLYNQKKSLTGKSTEKDNNESRENDIYVNFAKAL